jgi:predicted lipopolysaccharide heptosyltransferase III
MNSLREIVESSPGIRQLALANEHGLDSPVALGPARWDWSTVNRVLVVRLRSIGDAVLATPALVALRRFLPQARIDVLLEDWVAPVLQGLDLVDQVVSVPRGGAVARTRMARELRAAHYDVAYNLHGGTTATLLTRASGARHRVGFEAYQYRKLYNHLAPSPLDLWQRPRLHSVEQQLALLGWTGVPVTDKPATRLAVTESAINSVQEKLRAAGFAAQPFALIHPAAAFDTKQWATGKFARVVEDLHGRGLRTIAIAAAPDQSIVAQLIQDSAVPLTGLTNLSLPEVTALASRARLFVGNDSGIAHIAAAVGLPCVVIFGSSNITHWRPWTTRPSEVVREELRCQPCPGYFCAEFDQPECILRVPVERVIGAIDRVLRESDPTVSS